MLTIDFFNLKDKAGSVPRDLRVRGHRAVRAAVAVRAGPGAGLLPRPQGLRARR